MANVTYRANLKASSFPFLSELFGRSIIIKGPDQTTPIGKSEPGVTDSSNQGIPQIFYCHNVLPTDNGYKSIGYTTITADTASGFVKVVTLRDSTGLSANLAITSGGVLYVMQDGAIVWTLVGTPPVPGTIAGRNMTVGTVSGVSYIYFANVGCYTYTFGTNNIAASPLVPGTAAFIQADILGVVANRGYLIAYTISEVFWSSTLNALDFNPSLVTGAGGGNLEGARGIIVTIESVYGGFIVFTNHNCISAVASDNSRFPYTFVEITSGGGLGDPDFVSYDANSASVYAYTTGGLQQIAIKSATTVHPEVTDFISGNYFEDFDEITNTFSTTDAAGVVMKKRIVVVGNRYLVISYGISSLTHALVFDTAYRQWGKLKIAHVDCFEWDRTSTEVARKNLAFLTAAGAVKTVNFDITDSANSGVLILGKYQYVRARRLTLERVSLENINTGATFSLYDLPAADGKNFGTPLVGYLASSVGKFREYLFHNTALNHTLLFKGGFNVTSLVLAFHVSGAR